MNNLRILNLGGMTSTKGRANGLQPGGKCGCGPSTPFPINNCAPPGSLPIPARGQLPIAFATCPGDVITQPGRINAAWVPEGVVQDLFSRAANFSPATPLQDQDTYTTTPVTLTLAGATPTGTDPGERYLFPGVIIELTSSNNVPPGTTTITIGGAEGLATQFEDNTDYQQTLQVVTGHTGLSRFLLMFTKEVQGGAYPALVPVDGGSLLSTSNTVTTRHFVQEFNATFTCPDGTGIRIEGLSPVSDLWWQAMGWWYASALAAGG